MKQLFLLVIMVITSHAIAQAQLVIMKGDVAYVNEEPYARIKKEGCKSMQGPCAYEVFTPSGALVCKAKVMQQRKTDKNSRTPAVYYVQYRFYEPQDATCETPFPLSVTLHPSDVITEIMRAGLIYEGDMDEEAVQDFIDGYGNTFSSTNARAGNETPTEKPLKKKKRGDNEDEDE